MTRFKLLAGRTTRSTQVPTPAEADATGSVQSLGLLLRVWLTLGLQSFGGGTATLFLVRRTVVEQYRWLSDEEFARDWGLCYLAPGINLLGLTILIGYRAAGLAGSVVALLGLMLPSVTITIVMATLYLQLQQVTALQSALRAIVPATVGLGLLLAANTAQPLLGASRQEGRGSLATSIVLLAGSVLITALLHPPVIALLCGAGAIGAIQVYWTTFRRARRD